MTRPAANGFEQDLHAATPWAWATPGLLAINVLAFAATVAGGAGLIAPSGEVLVQWGSNFGLRTAAGEWWRLFTAMFLHFGIVHLAFNMLALWDMGRVVERLFGNGTFLASYLVAGIAGSLASLLWHPEVNSAGASGAIFGVFGMLAGYLLHRDFGLPPAIMKKHWGATVPFIGYNLFIGAVVPGIDNAAHLGGLAVGFAMGYALARPLDPARRRYCAKGIASLGAAVAAIALIVAQPLRSIADTALSDLEAREAMGHAVEQDRIASTAVKAAVDRLRAREIGSEEAARRIEQEGARRYAEAHERLSRVKLPGDSRDSKRQQALLRYTELRSEGYGMLAQSIRVNDEALAGKALARIGESNRVAKEMEAARR